MNVRKINSLKDNQCIECCFLWRDIKSLVVFIHNSLEDIGFHHILQEIDFDALPDGDEFEAFLGEWLKQFSPEIPVSFRLFPEAVSLQGASYAPPFFPSSPSALVSNTQNSTSSSTSSVLLSL